MTYTAPTISLDQLKTFNPCDDRLSVIAPAFNSCALNAQQALDAGATLDDLIWITSAIAKTNPNIEKRLLLWLVDVAGHVLRIYEKTEDSPAPRQAIETAKAFALGLATQEELDAAWDATRDATRDAAWDAAWEAARDAAWDAAWAAAWEAAWAATRDAAWAATRDAARATAWEAARDAEEQFQLNRLIYWLMEENPECLPIPAKGERT